MKQSNWARDLIFKYPLHFIFYEVVRGEAEGVVHGVEERILEREVLLVVASSEAGSVPERLPGSVF